MQETGNNHIACEATTNLIDETFDVSQSESYHLSIQTGTEGLSFCIFNVVIGKYVVLRHYPFSFENTDILSDVCRSIFENDDLLSLKYKSCRHLWISPRCTLMPVGLYDANDIETIFRFNHGWEAGESIRQNQITSVGLYNIFSCPGNLISLIQQYQPAITFFHHATSFIDTMAAESLSSARLNIAMFYYSGFIDIIIAKTKKILFYNTFEINSPEDTVYYLAGVLNLFDTKISSVKLQYAGNADEMPANIRIVNKYVARVVEREAPDTVTYSHYMTKQLRIRFSHLFNLYKCVL
ncbi:MAG: DUF3822 family protein [Tannerella sp.]|jgi:hypothetical protein|nr:DUF3822 family protein [Tannerella sp.]